MRKEKIGGVTLEMYDSIDELPMSRFQIYNRSLLLDMGIGCDVAGVESRIVSLRSFIKHKQYKSLDTELSNLHQSLLFIVGNTSLKFRCFSALVKSVNGKPFSDFSDDGLTELMDRLSKRGFTWGRLKSILSSLKKK